MATFALASVSILGSARGSLAYEGYGYQTVGGLGGTTYHVTNLSGSTSTGSFRWALGQPGPKIVVFDVGGTITLTGTAELTGQSGSFVTINGTSAPSPGITIVAPSNGTQDALYIADGAHDVIVTGLRFRGFNADGDGGDLVSLFGAPDPVFNVVVDHCTFETADDGALDITEDVTDVTVSWNLFRNNFKTQLIKYGVRARLSIHHNVYASNPIKGERNPLLWGDLNDVDFVNNINYGWDQRGLEIRHEGDGGSPGKRVHANVVNNLFTHLQFATIIDGLVYGTNPGPDAMDGGPACCPPQGAIVTGSNMGQLWVSGNILPPQNRDQYSTISGPRPVPPPAQVTTFPAVELKVRVLPDVGTVFRTVAEQVLLDLVAAAPPATFNMSINDVQVTEGNAGSANAVFTVSLTQPSAQVVTVQYTTAAGTAAAGIDYTTTSGTVTFPATFTSRTVNVAVIGDPLDEPNETFFVNLSGATGGVTIVDSQGAGTIVDNDPAPVLSVGDASVTEGDAGTVNAVFTVSMANLSAQAVNVSFATADNTAIGGADYTPRSGVLTFPPGSSSPQTVSVPVLGDTLDEPNERFVMALSSPTNALLSDAEGIDTILDDDGGVLQIIELAHGSDVKADLQAQPGPLADRDLYVVVIEPYSSYEVLVDEASGDLGVGNGPRLERIGIDLTTVIATSQAAGTGPGRTLRIRNSTALTVDAYVSVRSNSCGTDCGADATYRIRARETTGAIPRFNQFGTQRSVVLLQNRSNRTLAGTVHFWNTSGVRLVGQAFSVPPRGTFSLLGTALPALTGQTGTITIDHDGRYGDLEGKAVAVEPATGYAFDTPLLLKP